MTDSMIERMARAMRELDRSKAPANWNRWESAKPEHRQRYLERARAALEAMKEPTDAMLAASGQYNKDRMAEVWRAMISKAMEE